MVSRFGAGRSARVSSDMYRWHRHRWHRPSVQTFGTDVRYRRSVQTCVKTSANAAWPMGASAPTRFEYMRIERCCLPDSASGLRTHTERATGIEPAFSAWERPEGNARHTKN